MREGLCQLEEELRVVQGGEKQVSQLGREKLMEEIETVQDGLNP